jgi:hypothetical protein
VVIHSYHVLSFLSTSVAQASNKASEALQSASAESPSSPALLIIVRTR